MKCLSYIRPINDLGVNLNSCNGSLPNTTMRILKNTTEILIERDD